jgi:hypothetical protein
MYDMEESVLRDSVEESSQVVIYNSVLSIRYNTHLSQEA